MSTPAPARLGDLAAEAWTELDALFADAKDDLARVAGPDLEAYCVQIGRMRDAQARIDAEGLIVRDEKGRPTPHPAIALEKQAASEVRAWADRFRPRRRAR